MERTEKEMIALIEGFERDFERKLPLEKRAALEKLPWQERKEKLITLMLKNSIKTLGGFTDDEVDMLDDPDPKKREEFLFGNGGVIYRYNYIVDIKPLIDDTITSRLRATSILKRDPNHLHRLYEFLWKYVEKTIKDDEKRIDFSVLFVAYKPLCLITSERFPNLEDILYFYPHPRTLKSDKNDVPGWCVFPKCEDDAAAADQTLPIETRVEFTKFVLNKATSFGGSIPPRDRYCLKVNPCPDFNLHIKDLIQGCQKKLKSELTIRKNSNWS